MSKYFSFLRKKRSPSLPDDDPTDFPSLSPGKTKKHLVRKKAKKHGEANRLSVQSIDSYYQDEEGEEYKLSSEIDSIHSDNDSLLDNLSYGEICVDSSKLQWEKAEVLLDAAEVLLDAEDSRPSSSGGVFTCDEVAGESKEFAQKGQENIEACTKDNDDGDDISISVIDDFMEEAFNDLEDTDDVTFESANPINRDTGMNEISLDVSEAEREDKTLPRLYQSEKEDLNKKTASNPDDSPADDFLQDVLNVFNEGRKRSCETYPSDDSGVEEPILSGLSAQSDMNAFSVLSEIQSPSENVIDECLNGVSLGLMEDMDSVSSNEESREGLVTEDKIEGLVTEDAIGLVTEDKLEGLVTEDKIEGLETEDKIGLLTEDKIEGLVTEDKREGLVTEDRSTLCNDHSAIDGIQISDNNSVNKERDKIILHGNNACLIEQPKEINISEPNLLYNDFDTNSTVRTNEDISNNICSKSCDETSPQVNCIHLESNFIKEKEEIIYSSSNESSFGNKDDLDMTKVCSQDIDTKIIQESNNVSSHINEKLEKEATKLEKTKSKFEESKPKLKETESKLEEVEPKLKVSELELKEVEPNLEEAEIIFEETEPNLEETESEIEDSENELKETEPKLEETESKLKVAESNLKEVEPKLKETESKLKETDQKFKETDQKLKDTEPILKDTEPILKDTEPKSKLKEAELNLEETTPKLEHAVQKLEETEPKLDDTEPQLKFAEPKLDEAEPKLEGIKPKLEVTNIVENDDGLEFSNNKSKNLDKGEFGIASENVERYETDGSGSTFTMSNLCKESCIEFSESDVQATGLDERDACVVTDVNKTIKESKTNEAYEEVNENLWHDGNVLDNVTVFECEGENDFEENTKDQERRNSKDESSSRSLSLATVSEAEEDDYDSAKEDLSWADDDKPKAEKLSESIPNSLRIDDEEDKIVSQIVASNLNESSEGDVTLKCQSLNSESENNTLEKEEKLVYTSSDEEKENLFPISVQKRCDEKEQKLELPLLNEEENSDLIQSCFNKSTNEVLMVEDGCPYPEAKGNVEVGKNKNGTHDKSNQINSENVTNGSESSHTISTENKVNLADHDDQLSVINNSVDQIMNLASFKGSEIDEKVQKVDQNAKVEVVALGSSSCANSASQQRSSHDDQKLDIDENIINHFSDKADLNVNTKVSNTIESENNTDESKPKKMINSSPNNNKSKRLEKSKSENENEIKRTLNSEAEESFFIKVVNSDHDEAEARLAQRRAARAEARELRLRELEKQQQEQDNEEEQQYAANSYAPADKRIQKSTLRSNASNTTKSSTRTAVGGRSSVGRSSMTNSTGSGGQFSRRSSEDSTPDDALSTTAREIKAELKEVEEKFRKAMITNAQLDNEKATLTFEVEFLKDKYSELEENHIQLTKEHRRKCSENEQLRKLSNKLKEEVKMVRKVLQERDSLIQEYGLVLIGEENGEENAEDYDEEMEDETINDLSPRKIAVKKALLSQEASELLSKGAAKGSLDVRLKKYAEDKHDLEDEVRRLKLELEEELYRRRKENGQDYEKQKEASKSLNEYKFRIQKAEAEVATLQANVARLESLVTRYKTSTEELEISEEELKAEKRKLQRELRDMKEKCSEVETSKAYVKRQYEKLLHERGKL